MIPHLNELHEKFEKRGLTVIGVSDEAAATVRPFIEKNGMKYVIALEKSSAYQSNGIPHSWLVSPKGEVVWEGHPANLKESLIEEHLKNAVLTPQFSLPKDLKSAERDLNAGNFTAGIKALETHLKKPRSPDTEAAARAALEQATKYGEARLKSVDELAKTQDYGTGAEILRGLEKSFKGSAVGDKAKELLAQWKKDDKIKLELEAAAYIDKATEQISAKQWKNAAGFLSQVTKQKKFEGTKARTSAEKLLATVQKKL